MTKTGIFGGAFNPPHNGHINIAREAAKQLKLRRLLIIPTYESPHKKTKLADFDIRMEMCERAFSGVTNHLGCKTEISGIEREMGGVSFSINTIRELKRRFPDEQFYLIIGGDMLFSFTKWYKYESILKEANVCAAARGGDNYAEMLEFATEVGRIKVLPTDIVDVSSTEIRGKIAEKQDVHDLLPESVAAFIKEKNLYLET